MIEKSAAPSAEFRRRHSSSVFASTQRGRFAALATGLFLLFTAVALIQSRPGPGTIFEPGSVAWWLERPALPPSLPEIHADLHDVFAVESADGALDVWAAGNLGLIVHSSDGGWSWEQQFPLSGDPANRTPTARWTAPWQPIIAHAEEAVGQYSITVHIDGEESDVQYAQVTLIDANSSAIVATSRPDPEGAVRFERVVAGTYRIQAMKLTRITGLAEAPQLSVAELTVGGKKLDYDVWLQLRPSLSLIDSKPDISQTNSRPMEQTAGKDPFPGESFPPRVDPARTRSPEPQQAPLDLPGDPTPSAAVEVEPSPSHWRALWFSDALNGWAIDHAGVAHTTTDGGATWEPDADLPGDLWDVTSELWVGHPEAREGFRQFWIHEKTSIGWGIDSSGRAYRVSERVPEGFPAVMGPQAGGLWFDIESENPGDPFVCGADGAIGPLVTDPTSNQGVFRPVASGTDADLNSVFFLPGGRVGWAVGSDGVVIHTNDAGVTWAHQTKGGLDDAEADARRTPTLAVAPWYYLSLLLVGFVLVPAFKREEPIVTEAESIADQAVTDRPLEQGDPDPLGLGDVALGLSRFLRNENTSPPLSIAVTGRWGTGKSSLMNLLRADLRGFDYPTVWFNAWHHQNEDNLLAAVLQNIRLQAVPSLLTWHGWMFRFRLYAIRGWSSWAPVLGLLVVAAVSGGYFVEHMGGDEAGSWANRAWYLLSHLFGLLGGATSTDITESGSLVTTLAALYFMTTTANKKLSAFGLNPAALLRQATDGARVKHLEQKSTFRYDFANEFRDVTRALGKYRLVLFVDDLDRCDEDTVVEILEAVNFLVSSGECFVIMGLDRKYVECAVGLSFQKVAAEMAKLSTDDEERDPERQRQVFARQYLEKLVNIEVPVPVPDPDDSRKLLATDEHATEPAPDKLADLFAWLRLGRQVVGAGVAVGVLTLAFYVGGLIPSPPDPDIVAEQSEAGEAPGGDATGAVGAGSVAVADAVGAEAPTSPATTPDRATRELIDTSGQAAAIDIPNRPSTLEKYLGLWPLVPALFFLALAIRWVLTRRPDVVVPDSPRFAAALSIWHPMVSENQNTPRAIKRHLNRVRYLAMRQRPSTASYSIWDRFLASIKGIELAEADGSESAEFSLIPEETLVALATLNRFEETASHDVIADCLRDYGSTFPESDWSDYKESYNRIAGSVTVN